MGASKVGISASDQPPAVLEVTAYPEIDWRGWIGLRNALIHGYHRHDPPVIWRAIGELRTLVQASEAWKQPEA